MLYVSQSSALSGGGDDGDDGDGGGAASREGGGVGDDMRGATTGFAREWVQGVRRFLANASNDEGRGVSNPL